MADTAQTIIDLNQRLLNSIVQADWNAYAELCDETLTCFEPEARGHLVEGMPFHRFYFDLGASKGPVNVTMASPHVRMLGDSAALICYVRLVQKLDANNSPVTAHVEETRVWQKINGKWKHVHFHRVPLA
jgi:hypothetical protein